MSSSEILKLIDLAITAGSNGSKELHNIFYELDSKLGVNDKDTTIRNYFDCWADAVNHDYVVYKSQNPNEWVAAAKELKYWYTTKNVELSSKEIWKETLQKYT